jgi:hypothetical protein
VSNTFFCVNDVCCPCHLYRHCNKIKVNIFPRADDVPILQKKNPWKLQNEIGKEKVLHLYMQNTLCLPTFSYNFFNNCNGIKYSRNGFDCYYIVKQ